MKDANDALKKGDDKMQHGDKELRMNESPTVDFKHSVTSNDDSLILLQNCNKPVDHLTHDEIKDTVSTATSFHINSDSENIIVETNETESKNIEDEDEDDNAVSTWI